MRENKHLNQFDIGSHAYAFSRNCQNPKFERGTLDLTLDDLAKAVEKSTHSFLFKTKRDSQGKTRLMGGSYDYLKKDDYFTRFKTYVSMESQHFRNFLKHRFNKNKTLDFLFRIFDKNNVDIEIIK